MTRTSACVKASEAGAALLAAQRPVELLAAPTPDAWFDAAVANLPDLLLDHANCEKKAASTALALMFAYPEDAVLSRALSRLAREELRHFEQVQKLMTELGVPFRRMKPGRYAEGLRAAVKSQEPARRLDLLVCGAFIEARSCERFERLAPRLPEPVAGFYQALQASESRHFKLYLDLAVAHAKRSGQDAAARVLHFAELESRLATEPDDLFRFHSGAPVA